ncbi:MAG: SDR family NAD(P)-dependent oxidoreductase [Pedobacter sp.]|uniref:SDR family NAD(P)-dependent oxidoreductase n=1 Tax=Pedobacter sp. TaxID=1411316 RepID=UPI003561F4C0
MNIQNKVAIVTGGGSGIGRATALALAERGAKVVVCGRRTEKVMETVEMIEKNGGDAHWIGMDISYASNVSMLRNRTLDWYKKIDILINCAGIPLQKKIWETKNAEWDEVLNTNLKGTFLCCKELLQDVKVIVNVSSIMGLTGGANASAYSASKFGIIGLTQSIVAECPDVKTYVICPCTVITDMNPTGIGMTPDYVAGEILKIIESNRKADGKPIIIDNLKNRFLWFGHRLRSLL